MSKPRFIDLFAGIGGTRLAFEQAGAECVFTSEWDKFAQVTYAANFEITHPISGDIREIDAAMVPPHDILVAGFPCQPFSLAGVSKKNSLGREHGFRDQTQGTLFFEISRIIEARRPRAFLLENVRNLLSHDSGRTFEIIRDTLTDELGYKVSWRIMSSSNFVPQKRSRIFIVGFRDQEDFDWSKIVIPDEGPLMHTILHREDGHEQRIDTDADRFFDFETSKVQLRYTLSQKLWRYLQNYAEKHRAAGNGFGFGLVGPNGVARTLSARYHKDGSEILVYQDNAVPRRLTPRECARLMGFPDSFAIPVSDSQAYRQLGNSVVVPLVRAIAVEMLKVLD